MQKGGAYADANAWAAAIKEIYNPSNRMYRDANNMFIIDKLAGVAQINDTMHITIKQEIIIPTGDSTTEGNKEVIINDHILNDVAARAAVFMFDFLTQEEHTYESYRRWYAALDSDELTKGYKKQLLDIENAIRTLANQEEISDIGDESKYPLYIWALVFSIPSKSASDAADMIVPELISQNVVKRISEFNKAASEQSE